MAFTIDDLASVISHWSADQISGLSDGDPVDSLPDSVAAWDMEASGSARPLYRPTGINSLPAIEFDGVDDWMLTGSTKSISAVPIFAAWVMHLDTLKNYNAQFALHTNNGQPINGNADFMSWGYSSGDNLIRQSTSYRTSNSTLATASPCLITGGVSIRGIVNLTDGIRGSISGHGGAADDFDAGNMYASYGDSTLSGAEFDGKLAELVLWEETELCESRWIEGVLAHKFGITLPTSHPFYSAAPTSAPGAGGGSGGVDPLRGGLIV